MKRFTNDFIRKGLAVLTKYVFMKERRFEELQFSLLGFGRKIAEGFFFKISNENGNEAMSAVVGKTHLTAKTVPQSAW